MSDSLRPYGLKPTRLLCPWDSPGKNTGVVCHALPQGIFLTQGSNLCLLCLLHWQTGSLPLAPLGIHTWAISYLLSSSQKSFWTPLDHKFWRPTILWANSGTGSLKRIRFATKANLEETPSAEWSSTLMSFTSGCLLPPILRKRPTVTHLTMAHSPKG